MTKQITKKKNVSNLNKSLMSGSFLRFIASKIKKEIKYSDTMAITTFATIPKTSPTILAATSKNTNNTI